MEIEIWKSLDFLGYPDYEISNFGNVKSLNYNHTGKERLLKPRKDKGGYMRVLLCKNGKGKNFRVHRLVAMTFLENPNNLSCVNHKDENKDNNHVNNLEFCTHEYNNNYGTRNERAIKKISKAILQYSLIGEFVKEWSSIKQASKELNINQSNISGCCKHKLKTCGNFIWRYKE